MIDAAAAAVEGGIFVIAVSATVDATEEVVCAGVLSGEREGGERRKAARILLKGFPPTNS